MKAILFFLAVIASLGKLRTLASGKALIGCAVLALTAAVPSSQNQIAELLEPDESLVYDVVVQDDVAYLSQGPHLTVLDVSTPEAPRVISRIRLPIESTSGDIVRGIAVAGSRAYIADGARGIWIVDVSMSSAPALLGSYLLSESSTARAVTVAGASAYVAGGSSGLWILDVLDPSAPKLRASFDTPGYANGVAVTDSLVFVADGSAGLSILDVSDPESPFLRGSLDTSGRVRDVAVAGSLAFLVDGAGLSIVKVLQPEEPILRSSVGTPGIAAAVALSGSFAFVADGWKGLAIIDVSVPSQPILLDAFNPSSMGYAPAVAVSRKRAYVANTYAHPGLKTLDLSDPSAPVLLGSYDAPRHPWDIVMGWLFRFVLPVGLLATVVAAAVRARRRYAIAPVTAERAHLGTRFWLQWVLATALGLSVGMVLGWAVGFALRSEMAVALGKGLPWLVVGLTQWHVLRREVGAAGWWIVAYAVGGTVVAVLAVATGWSLGDVPAAGGGVILGIAVGFVVGVIQWFAFRRRLSLTLEWTGASTIGWAVGLTLGFMLAHGGGFVGAEGGVGPVAHGLVGAIAGTGVGALTGIVIVWMLRHPLPKAAGGDQTDASGKQ